MGPRSMSFERALFHRFYFHLTSIRARRLIATDSLDEQELDASGTKRPLRRSLNANDEMTHAYYQKLH